MAGSKKASARPEKRRFDWIEQTASGAWRARVRINGKIERGPSRPTQREAFKDAEEIREQGESRRGLPQTIGEAFDAIEVECTRRRRRQATLAWYKDQRKQIEKEFGADRKVRTISVQDVQRFLDKMEKADCSPATLRTRLRALRRAFLICGRPAVGVRELVIPDVEERDPSEFLTLPEVHKLLVKLRHRIEQDEDGTEGARADFWVTAFLLVTGIRRAEMARMLKEDLDVKAGQIRVRAAKTKPRVLPLPDTKDTKLVVAGLIGVSSSEWIIPGDSEAKRVEWLARMARRVQAAEPKALLHNLRRATATLLSELDPPAPMPVVVFLMGHSMKNQLGVTGLYTRPSPAVVKAVAARLWHVVAHVEPERHEKK